MPNRWAASADGACRAASPSAPTAGSIGRPGGSLILTALAADGAATRPEGAPPEWPFVPLWPARPLATPPPPQDIAPPPNPPRDPYTLVRPLALALAPNGDLVIADAGKDGAGRLLVMTLPDGRMRHIIPMAEPVAISFDQLGRACVADAGAHTILRFDRFWRREADYPHQSVPPIDGLTHLAHARRDPCGCGCGGPADATRRARPSLTFGSSPRAASMRSLARVSCIRTAASPFRHRPAAGSRIARRCPADARGVELSPDGQLLWQDPAWPSRDPWCCRG